MRAIAWLLAAGVALTPLAAEAQSLDMLPESRYVKQGERFVPGGGGPIDLHFAIAREASGQTDRFVNTSHAALTLMSAWFGPPFTASLSIAGVFSLSGSLGWAAGANLVSVPAHWLSPARDQRLERELIDGIVREYWFRNRAPTAFEYALVAYTGASATHQLLAGSNFATLTFFGGFIPLPLRPVLLSPPIADPRPRAWHFDSLTLASDNYERDVRALQTIERYVGWPTMLEALARLRTADRRDAESLANLLSDVRGTDMRSLVAECLRPDAVFDYAMDGLQSSPGSSGLVETTVTITRHGSGRFALASGEATMPVLIRFANGSEVRDYFDGARPVARLIYSAPAAAISATIDPDLMLLLDVNRENNSIRQEQPVAPVGVRLALHWMAWLQNAMLTYTALL